MNIVTRFTLETLERAVETGASTALVSIGGAVTNVIGWNWAVIGGSFAAGAITSVLISLASQPVGDPLTPSILPAQGKTVASPANAPGVTGA